MIRNALIASVIVLGTLGAAQAQDNCPCMIGGGDNAEVVYTAPNHNIVGGGAATITGGGDNMRIAYGSGTTTQEQRGLVAEMIGGGNDRQIVYHQLPAAPNASQFAGRPARNGG